MDFRHSKGRSTTEDVWFHETNTFFDRLSINITFH